MVMFDDGCKVVLWKEDATAQMPEAGAAQVSRRWQTPGAESELPIPARCGRCSFIYISYSESKCLGLRVDYGYKTLGFVCFSSFPNDNMDGETSKEFAKEIDGARVGNLLHSSTVSTTQYT
jgi:hypothetical protein